MTEMCSTGCILYETLGGNNSRTALSELCSERADLAEDQRYTRRMVSIYVNLTDEEAQHLAIKHNRQQSFIHQMITQDKVLLIAYSRVDVDSKELITYCTSLSYIQFLSSMQLIYMHA